MKNLKNQKGITLVELLIGALISIIIVSAVLGFYITQHNHWLVQEEISDMQQNSRALLDELTRYVRKAGYGKFFSHSLGHGLGLQVHEMPRVSAVSADVLETGNVITIEPGIYIPGVGGVRIEDDVVIRDGRCEVLTKSPKQLINI